MGAGHSMLCPTTERHTARKTAGGGWAALSQGRVPGTARCAPTAERQRHNQERSFGFAQDDGAARKSTGGRLSSWLRDSLGSLYEPTTFAQRTNAAGVPGVHGDAGRDARNSTPATEVSGRGPAKHHGISGTGAAVSQESDVHAGLGGGMPAGATESPSDRGPADPGGLVATRADEI